MQNPQDAETSAGPPSGIARLVDLLPKPAAVREGDALYVNAATCALTGYAVDALATIDQWFKTLYGERHLAMRMIYERHRRNDGGDGPTVMPLTTRDGTHCYV
ncbi:MAG: hypothetical protein R3F55_13645, partial [Alphaproteobacteria bacterium]